MAEKNLGTVKGIIISDTEPVHTYVLWAKPVVVGVTSVVDYYRWDGAAWVLITDEIIAMLGNMSIQDKESVNITGGLVSGTTVAGQKRTVRTVTAAVYNVVPGDDIILVDATANNVTINLPDTTLPTSWDATNAAGIVITVVRIDGGANTVTIQGTGGQVIGGGAGAASVSLAAIDKSYILAGAHTFWAIAGKV